MFSTHHDAQEQRARRRRRAFSIGYALLGSVALAGWGATAAAQEATAKKPTTRGSSAFTTCRHAAPITG